MFLVTTSLTFTNPPSSTKNSGVRRSLRTAKESAAGTVYACNNRALIGTGFWVITNTMISPVRSSIGPMGVNISSAIAAASFIMY